MARTGGGGVILQYLRASTLPLPDFGFVLFRFVLVFPSPLSSPSRFYRSFWDPWILHVCVCCQPEHANTCSNSQRVVVKASTFDVSVTFSADYFKFGLHGEL